MNETARIQPVELDEITTALREATRGLPLEPFSQYDCIDKLTREVRALWGEVEALRAALAPFAEERIHGSHFKCEGNADTGYVCGFDDEGEPIRGFTDFCRWCVARRLFDLASPLASPEATRP